MAITTVKGSVSRVFFDGRAAEVTESFEIKGKEITKRWACWFQEEHGLNVGDVAEVSGLHDDKIDSWDDKTSGEKRYSVKRSLNKARLGVSGPETGHGATNMAPSDSDTGSAIWDAQGANEWPVMEIPDNPWPADENVPF